MATLEELEEKLNAARSLLDEAAGQIRDVPLEPRRENILRIADLLSGIGEIQNQIYRLRPDLIPEYLWEVSRGEWPGLIIAGAFRRAAKEEAAGDMSAAVQTLRFLIRCQPNGEHVAKANAEIARMTKHDG